MYNFLVDNHVRNHSEYFFNVVSEWVLEIFVLLKENPGRYSYDIFCKGFL